MQIAMRQPRPRARTPLVLLAAAAFLDLAHCAQLVREDPQGPCSCDCCEVEESRDAGADGSPDQALQCAFAQSGSLFREKSHAGACGTLCLKGDSDSILSASESGMLDTQRFCFFECEPGQRNFNAEEDGGQPKRGDPCQPLGKSEAGSVEDSSGNARPPMEQPRVRGQFLSRKVNVAYAGAAPAPAPAPGPAGPGGPAAGWESVSDPIPEYVARFMEWAEDAKKKAEESAEDVKAINKLADKSADALPLAINSANQAAQAAQDAHDAEGKVAYMLGEMRKEAKKEALALVPEVLKEMQGAARAQAKSEGQAKAAALKSEMMGQVATAGADAMKPYHEAMNRAAATSATYGSAGDAAVGQSLALQMQAQALQDQARMWNIHGDTSKAQKLMQQSRKLMNVAGSLNSAANGYYGTMMSVGGTLGAYEVQAGQAAWHAERMLNPDALPPAPLMSMR